MNNDNNNIVMENRQFFVISRKNDSSVFIREEPMPIVDNFMDKTPAVNISNFEEEGDHYGVDIPYDYIPMFVSKLEEIHKSWVKESNELLPQKFVPKDSPNESTEDADNLHTCLKQAVKIRRGIIEAREMVTSEDIKVNDINDINYFLLHSYTGLKLLINSIGDLSNEDAANLQANADTIRVNLMEARKITDSEDFKIKNINDVDHFILKAITDLKALIYRLAIMANEDDELGPEKTVLNIERGIALKENLVPHNQ